MIARVATALFFVTLNIHAACEKDAFPGEYREKGDSAWKEQVWYCPSRAVWKGWSSTYRHDEILNKMPLVDFIAQDLFDEATVWGKEPGCTHVPGNVQQIKINVGSGDKTFFDHLFASAPDQQNEDWEYNAEALELNQIRYVTGDPQGRLIKVPTKMVCDTNGERQAITFQLCVGFTEKQARDLFNNRYLIYHTLDAKPTVAVAPLYRVQGSSYLGKQKGRKTAEKTAKPKLVRLKKAERAQWLDELREKIHTHDPRRKGVLTLYAILAQL
jgi:hypothetical protein